MSRESMFYWQSDRPFTIEQIKEIFLDRKEDYNKESLGLAAVTAMGEKITNLSSPINFGSVNIVCPFETETGKKAVIRVHPKQVKNEYFHAESQAMKHASAVGLPVPQTIYIDDSKSLFEFDYMVTSLVKGQVMQLAVEQDPSKYSMYLKQLGKYLGQLHTIKTKGFGFFDNNKAKSGQLIGIHKKNEDHYTSALDLDEQFYKENPGWIDPSLIQKSIRILRSNLNVAAACNQPTLVHNDIADWNTVVDGDVVTGILDWDECFSGDPVFEFATLSLFYSSDQMEIIKEGYQETNKLPKDYDQKFNLYVLRYIINKSKISIKKLSSIQKESTRKRFNLALEKLKILVKVLD